MNWIRSFWKKLTTPNVPTRSGNSQLTQNSSDETMNKFSPRAQKVLALSREEAVRFRHSFVGTEHLLLGIVALQQGTAVKVLGSMGVDLESIREEVEKSVGTGREAVVHPMIPFTPRVKKVLALAAKEARTLNHTYVGTEHILLGLLREGDGVAYRVLLSLGLNIESTRLEVLKELDPNNIRTPKQETVSSTADSEVSKQGVTTHVQIASVLGTPVETNKRYDVACTDWCNEVTVYKGVRFKSLKQLFQKSQYESYFGFIELEQSGGKSVFVSRSSIIRFWESDEETNSSPS